VNPTGAGVWDTGGMKPDGSEACDDKGRNPEA